MLAHPLRWDFGRCSTLLDTARQLLGAARRCSTLLDAARRCSTLLDAASSSARSDPSASFNRAEILLGGVWAGEEAAAATRMAVAAARREVGCLVIAVVLIHVIYVESFWQGVATVCTCAQLTDSSCRFASTADRAS
jgi:hypothetical protein